MPCIVDPYSNNFDGKMATECFGYFTLNGLGFKWSQKQKADLKGKMLSVITKFTNTSPIDNLCNTI